MTIFLEPNLDGIIWLIAGIIFGPAVVLALIGLILKKSYKKASKVFFILAVLYVVVSFGVCGTMMS